MSADRRSLPCNYLPYVQAHLVASRDVEASTLRPAVGYGVVDAGLVVAVAACHDDAAIRQR